MSSEDATVDTQQVCKLLDDMTASMASAREAIESLKTKCVYGFSEIVFTLIMPFSEVHLTSRLRMEYLFFL